MYKHFYNFEYFPSHLSYRLEIIKIYPEMRRVLQEKVNFYSQPQETEIIVKKRKIRSKAPLKYSTCSALDQTVIKHGKITQTPPKIIQLLSPSAHIEIGSSPFSQKYHTIQKLHNKSTLTLKCVKKLNFPN
ncbi:hypothetical protein NUSPORA_00696 [Nucleospora cyclopteri]